METTREGNTEHQSGCHLESICQCKDGSEALHFSVVNGFVEVTKFLVHKGCDINTQDGSGCTALHRAVSRGHLDVVAVLLEAGGDINIQDQNGEDAVHKAAWNGFSKTLQLLIKYNATLSIANKNGFTALHLAAQKGHNESTRVLLYAGCPMDLKNIYGDTPLHTAARYGHAGVTRILLSARAQVNEQNRNGDTVLHIAAALNRRKISKLMVEAGINASIRNKQNESAVDIAKRKNYNKVIAIIQDHCESVSLKAENPEIDNPVSTPSTETADHKPKEKTRKYKLFKFLKLNTKEVTNKRTRKETKENQQGKSPSSQQGETIKRGLFSNYIAQPGTEFYTDLAGNVKQGPVGYIPTCEHDSVIDASHVDIDVKMHHRSTAYGQKNANGQENTDGHLCDGDRGCAWRINQDDNKGIDPQDNNQLNKNRLDNKNRNISIMNGRIQNWLEHVVESNGHNKGSVTHSSPKPSAFSPYHAHADLHGPLLRPNGGEANTQSTDAHVKPSLFPDSTYNDCLDETSEFSESSTFSYDNTLDHCSAVACLGNITMEDADGESTMVSREDQMSNTGGNCCTLVLNIWDRTVSNILYPKIHESPNHSEIASFMNSPVPSTRASDNDQGFSCTGSGEQACDGHLRSNNGYLRTNNGDLRTNNGDLRTNKGDLRTDNGDLRTNNGNLRLKLRPKT